MRGKMARSAAHPPFPTVHVAAAVRATRLPCQNAGKAQKFALVRRFIWGIPVNPILELSALWRQKYARKAGSGPAPARRRARAARQASKGSKANRASSRASPFTTRQTSMIAHWPV